MKVKDSIYQLVVEDLTSLGGPMGTERVSHIGSWFFINGLPSAGERAAAFAKKRFKVPGIRQDPMGLPNRMAVGRYYDCRFVGLRLTKVRIQK